MAVQPGVDVVSSDGERLGRLEQLLADFDADIFDGILVDLEVEPSGRHFADAEHVGDIYERAVFLTIPAAEVGKLTRR